MKKIFLLIAIVAMALPSCKKINEAIDDLDNRLNKLEQEAIPTIDEQISAINTTLDNLDAMDKELKSYIDGLQETADNLQKQINATNSNIDAVKAELQGEISAAKAEVLAELEALETELKNELVQINTTIETLKAKDKELDNKIANLKTYVDNELKNTEDWVNATFATLEQYNALVSEVATIKEQIKAINQSITDLETKLTTKINEDIANAVSTLNADIQQKVKGITDAYTNAIKSAKEEITTAYTTAIATAISNLETSLKSWVSEQLENYYTIAEVEAKISALENAMTKGDKALQEELNTLKSQLEAAKAELTAAYKKAIEEAINTNNGVFDTKITNEIDAVNQRIDNEVETINSKIAVIEARLNNVEAQVKDLLARIQSVSYIPTYNDGKATVKYVEGVSQVTLDFEISPKDAVAELAKVWVNAVSVKAVYTQTRAVSFIDMQITNFESDATNGVISVTASGKNLSEEFFAGTQSASVRLSISDGNNSVTTDYIPMVAKYDESIIDGDTIINGVLYIATTQGLAQLNDPNIVSAKLIATLDMTGVEWTPIENFAGVFDGNSSKGYEIKNISAPLFNMISGEVKNLKLSTNITEITENITGTVACSLAGIIDNCEVSGKIEDLDIEEQYSSIKIAGVVGQMLENATICNTTNNCDITISTTFAINRSSMDIGGITSRASNTNLAIDNCINNGDIIWDVTTDTNSNSSTVHIGGIVAYMPSSSSLIIRGKAINNGNLIFTGNCRILNLGGVFARIQNTVTFSEDSNVLNSGTISNYILESSSYKYGMVSGAARIGGVVGSNYKSQDPITLEGFTNLGNIYIENISATQFFIGGIVGGTNAGVVGATCYCDIKAPESANRGWIMGTARTSTIQAQNCKLGASPQLVWNDIRQEWREGDPLFDGTNFLDYIYGGTTTWEGTTYDGCTYISENPEL